MKSLPAPLTDPWFDAKFYNGANADVSYYSTFDGDPGWNNRPVEFAEAQGLILWCPCGYGEKDAAGNERFPTDLSLGKGRPHAILVPFANPPCGIQLPADHGPVGRDGKTRPRWQVAGSGLHDLTTNPSIAVGTPECWHGWIQGGIVK